MRIKQADQARYLNALTGLRFVAAFAIICRHFGGYALATAPKPIAHIAENGFVSVSLFFILSGFVLTYSYASGNGAIRGGRIRFWSSRLARIYPAYLLAFLLSGPFFLRDLASHHSVSQTLGRTFIGGALVLTLTQSWFPPFANYWNSPAWSLSVETFFYLVFPFFVPRFAKLRLKTDVMAILGSWVAAIAAPLLYFALCVNGLQNHDEVANALQCNPVLRLPEFLIGILTAKVYMRTNRHSVAGPIFAVFSASAVLLVLSGARVVPEVVLGNGLLAPLFAVLIWSLAQGGWGISWLLGNPVFVFLGEISYSIYVLQEPIARLMKFTTQIEPSRRFGTYLSVLIGTSALCYLFVERLARPLIRGRLETLLDVVHPRPPIVEAERAVARL